MNPAGCLLKYLAEAALHGVPDWSGSRSTARTRARQLAAWAARSVCPSLSYPTIAHYLGWGDHTSALSAVQKVTRLRATDKAVEEATDQLIQMARAEREALIVEINRQPISEFTYRPELVALMNDVRSAARRMNAAVERVETFIANHPESLK